MRSIRLDRPQLLAYGLPGLPLAVLSIPLVVYLPALYTREHGLSLLAVGGALLAARLFDVCSDVLIGTLTDRGQRTGTSRKVFICLGVPLLLFGIDRLFAPAAGVTFWSLLLWSLLAYLGWTLIAVPYYAWGAELSADPHQRTRLAGSREGFTIAGIAAVIFIPALLGIADEPAAIMQGVAAVTWWVLPAAILLAVLHVPENSLYSPPAAHSPARMFTALLANRPMQRLVAAYTLSSVANALPATLFIFYITHVLAAAHYLGLFLGLYFIAGMLALPAWITLARRYGKVRSWALSMLLASLAFAAAPWLGTGDLLAYGLICLSTGIAYGADLALPASLQADMVDLDRHYSGSRRAGLLFGLWGMATKLAAALGVGLAFGALQLAGFDPQADNSPATISLLALLYGLAPIVLKLVSVALIWRLLATLPTANHRGAPAGSEEELHHVEIPADAGTGGWSARRLHHHAT
jgi:Na+/melibiose symporter-like transporter